jgi:hypothetical protein
MPGIFEEALVALEQKTPLYLLGGFGGATEILARALLDTGRERPPELTVAWHKNRTPGLAKLETLSAQLPMPSGTRAPVQGFDALWAQIQQGRENLGNTLRTGLGEDENRELLLSRDVAQVVKLVRKGLEKQLGLQTLPS